jgi:hypothetical protein
MSQQRIYIVQNKAGGFVMVKAINQAQALRHVARNTYTISIASALSVAENMQSGMKIEDATAETEAATEE